MLQESSTHSTYKEMCECVRACVCVCVCVCVSEGKRERERESPNEAGKSGHTHFHPPSRYLDKKSLKENKMSEIKAKIISET